MQPKLFRHLGAFVVCATPLLAFQSTPASVAEKLGHSFHGEAFDSGPREKPWSMTGIGVAHFPITTKNPEGQRWFDQGNALLHSFWFYEPERAFRWCLKLDPPNPLPSSALSPPTDADKRPPPILTEP